MRCIKEVHIVFDSCKECPYIRSGDTKGIVNFCSMMRMEVIPDKEEIPDWCPLHDAEKRDFRNLFSKEETKQILTEMFEDEE